MSSLETDAETVQTLAKIEGLQDAESQCLILYEACQAARNVLHAHEQAHGCRMLRKSAA